MNTNKKLEDLCMQILEYASHNVRCPKCGKDISIDDATRDGKCKNCGTYVKDTDYNPSWLYKTSKN